MAERSILLFFTDRSSTDPSCYKFPPSRACCAPPGVPQMEVPPIRANQVITLVISFSQLMQASILACSSVSGTKTDNGTWIDPALFSTAVTKLQQHPPVPGSGASLHAPRRLWSISMPAHVLPQSGSEAPQQHPYSLLLLGEHHSNVPNSGQRRTVRHHQEISGVVEVRDQQHTLARAHDTKMAVL